VVSRLSASERPKKESCRSNAVEIRLQRAAISVVAADTVSARKLPIIETVAYGYFPL
jgi:hypothetical protein